MSDYRRYVGHQVVVQLDDLSVSGTLVRAGQETLDLENAATLSPSGDPRPIDGVVLIPRASVDWVQVP